MKQTCGWLSLSDDERLVQVRAAPQAVPGAPKYR